MNVQFSSSMLSLLKTPKLLTPFDFIQLQNCIKAKLLIVSVPVHSNAVATLPGYKSNVKLYGKKQTQAELLTTSFNFF